MDLQIDQSLEWQASRQAFLQEAQEALKHYHETGSHVTVDEMDTWMDSLYTENELPMPICHN